jgi:hypothetical protein
LNADARVGPGLVDVSEPFYRKHFGRWEQIIGILRTFAKICTQYTSGNVEESRA